MPLHHSSNGGGIKNTFGCFEVRMARAGIVSPGDFEASRFNCILWHKFILMFVQLNMLCLYCFTKIVYIYSSVVGWYKGKTSDCGATSSGFDFQLWQGFLRLLFCFAVAMLFHLVCLTYCILWPIIRVSR